MARPKEIIENEIKELRSKLKFDLFGTPEVDYIPDYDEAGNLVGFHMDPEQDKILNKLEELEHELRVYYPPENRGEYGGGSSNGQ